MVRELEQKIILTMTPGRSISLGSENSFRLKMSYVVETTVSMLTAKAPGPMALFSAIATRWAS